MKHLLLSITLILAFTCLKNVKLIGQISQDHFIGSVIELEKDAEDKYSAKLISHLIHEGKIKTPTESESKAHDSDEFVIIRYNDQLGKSIREFSFSQPFLGHYEYVNDEGQLEHADIPEAKKSYLLRFRNDPTITSIQIFMVSNGNEIELLNQAIK